MGLVFFSTNERANTEKLEGKAHLLFIETDFFPYHFDMNTV